MSETFLLPSGEAYPIEWSLWDGVELLTGKTVTLSIERCSDGKYWTGSAWQVGDTTVNMAERSGSADLVGKYRYAFTVGDDIYDCHTTYTEGSFTTHFRVRLIGQSFAGGAIYAGPISSVARAEQLLESPVKLEMFALETRAFVLEVRDANDDPIDLSAITLRFVVHDSQKVPIAQFKIEDGSITKTGDDNEIATVTVNGSQATAATTEWHWKLWDLTNSRVLMHGPFVVYPAKKDA